jgi:hypothetical protein
MLEETGVPIVIGSPVKGTGGVLPSETSWNE